MNELRLPDEHLVHLHINQTHAFGLICTRDAIQELTVGFLFNEGFIDGLSHIKNLRIDGDSVFAEVEASHIPALQGMTVRTSGLGGIAAGAECLPATRTRTQGFSGEYLLHCADIVDDQAVMYDATGGMHCSALFHEGALLALCEDIGRHNTLDKLAGRCLLRHIPADGALLITSGRVTSEMVRKAARIGVAAIASYSTATQQARDTARSLNMALTVYLRRGCITI